MLPFPRGRAFEPGGVIRDQIPEDLVTLCEKVWGLFVQHGGAIENTGGCLNYEPPLEDSFDRDVAKPLHPPCTDSVGSLGIRDVVSTSHCSGWSRARMGRVLFHHPFMTKFKTPLKASLDSGF